MTSGGCWDTISVYNSTTPEGEGFSIVLPVQGDQKPYQCGLCSRTFDVQDDLVHHVQNHPKPFQCGYCDASFDSKSELKDHVDAHSFFMCVSKKTSVPGCSTEVTKETLHRTDINEMKVSVEECAKKVPEDDSMTDNFAESLSDVDTEIALVAERPKACIRKKKMRKASRPIHIPMSPDDLPMCPTCGRRFQLQVDLKRHSAEEHGDDRPFQCTQCPSRFKQNVHLIDHMNSVHRVGKPHACPMCGDTFKLLSYMRLHIRRVHHVDPFTILGGRSRKRYTGDQENSKMTAPAPSHKVSGVSGNLATAAEKEETGKATGELCDVDCDAGLGSQGLEAEPMLGHQQTDGTVHTSQAPGSRVSTGMEWDYFINEEGTRIDIVATMSNKAEQEDAFQTSEQQDAVSGVDKTPKTEKSRAYSLRKMKTRSAHRSRTRDSGCHTVTNKPGLNEDTATVGMDKSESDGLTNAKLFKCGECAAVCPTAAKLREHWKGAHNTCACGDMFMDPLEMYNHRYTVHGEVKRKKSYKPYLCAVCGAGFRVASYLRDHIDKLHLKKSGGDSGKNAKPHKCYKCGKTFPYLSWYTRHYQAHTDSYDPNTSVDQ